MNHKEIVFLVRGWGSSRRYVPFRFRFDPVPGTGKWWNPWKFYNFYKKPKTTQERRWAIAYPEFVRAGRSARNLPNAWDDWPRTDYRHSKCWKKCRKVKKQWMKNASI